MSIQIYDTTLRDGTQSEGFTLSGIDKTRIAKRLDAIGVAFIEGGWPGSNPKDAEFFERARDMEFKHSLVTAFGATCRVQGGPEDDALEDLARLDGFAPTARPAPKRPSLVSFPLGNEGFHSLPECIGYFP